MKVRGLCIWWFGRLFLMIWFAGHSIDVVAQPAFCNGNLGDNIFTAGDFGSGTPNVVQSNPGLAPGFQYTTQVPPDDGEYTLTNNINAWSYVYPTWLEIGDNDVNPNGYMMVVNASFAPGIFYEQIIDNLCENTLYEFTADVINLIRSGTTGHILPNVSFLIDDVVSYSSGAIPQDEDWHTYGFTFFTGPGQFAVKLSLRNNAPGGTGNDLALDNISFKPCGPSSSLVIEPTGKICENSLYPLLTAQIDADTGAVQWQFSIDEGRFWNDIPGAINRSHQVQQLEAGRYFYRYLYSNTFSNINNPKCRIVSDFILVEIVPVEFLIRDTLCEGLTLEVGGIEYGETGIYQQMFVASNGCDSIVTVDLVIVPDPPIIAEYGILPTSCEGNSDGTIVLESVSGGSPPYTFYINDDFIPPPFTSVTVPSGIYTIRIENEYGCFTEEEVIVEEGPRFDIETIEDTTIVLGYSVLLNTQSNLPVISASWSPTKYLECPGCISTLATPFEDQTYIIEAVAAEGCTAKDTVTIRVDDRIILYVPNIFSPNGDQVNDYFSISTDPRSITSIDEVLILDRWGGVIAYQGSMMPQESMVLWDGSTNSKEAPTGVYVYLITFKMADGISRTVHGDVTLLR
jgi:gliding motility-associated-like protein